jgi:hypothetical protein
VTPTHPESDAGLVLIRAWVEPEQVGEAQDALRARIITAPHGEPAGGRTVTAAGVENVVAVVREFLTGLTAERRATD